jgi:hypothetical protein
MGRAIGMSGSAQERDRGSVERALIHALHTGEDSKAFVRRILVNNQVIKHNYSYNAIQTHQCALEGCPCTFEVTIVPRQVLYPKYCESHRSEFRRKFHLRKMDAAQKYPH